MINFIIYISFISGNLFPILLYNTKNIMYFFIIATLFFLLLIFLWVSCVNHSLRLNKLEERMKKIEKDAVKITFEDPYE